MEKREQDSKSEDGDLTGRDAYNIVSDTVTGANVRLKDNVLQAIAIGICVILGAVAGAAFVQERVAGAVVGAFLGLVIGFFASGIFLMIYRAVMHIRGRHE